MKQPFLIALGLWLAMAVSDWAQGASNTIRVGAFPNITHAQAMVGEASGWFDKAMGPQVKVQWTSFNAGPSAIEALFAGAIDMTYVGPNPAINGYVRSNGEAVRVVAGAAEPGIQLGRAGANESSAHSVFAYFLWLGAVGFGGPIALAGHIQQDLVVRRGWVRKEDYLRVSRGIGFLYSPQDSPKNWGKEVPRWIYQLGEYFVRGALTMPNKPPSWRDLPQMMRLTITTHNVLEMLGEWKIAISAAVQRFPLLQLL